MKTYLVIVPTSDLKLIVQESRRTERVCLEAPPVRYLTKQTQSQKAPDVK